ncbi:MAG TPA: rod shape-determining protein MreC [Actinomycetota bacterium]
MIRMFDRTRRRRLLLAALVLASITIITLDFRAGGNDGPLDKIGRGVMTVLAPVQRGLVTVFRPVGSFFAGFTRVPSLQQRIIDLERANANLQAELQQVEDVTRENESLRQLLALAQRNNFKTKAVQVIGVSQSNFERSIIIGGGSAAGVAVDMPVVAGEGLVGRVVSVSRDSARVLLITDRSSAVAARLATNGKAGVVDGAGTGRLRFELLDPLTAVSPGDRVVTSGYDRGLYPSGIVIGTVTDAPPAGSNLSRVVTVEPVVDFSRLDYVLLVVGEKRDAEAGR